ncbi:hypothetical protein [Lysobacter sp. F6437]|uniref:hypothetical protein n=1 Tax=Lysobacter sp. F6437 TaxID=3459296 RepID=UPI00403D8191
MTTRAMRAMAGFDWLKNGINLGRNNPKAVFGGAALLMVCVIAVVMVAALLAGVLVAALGNGIAAVVLSSLVIILPVFAVMGMLMVGYLRLVAAVESGQPAAAFDVFGGFSDMATSMRAIGFVVLLSILQNLLVIGLLALFAGGVIEWYMQAIQASADGTTPTTMLASMPEGLGIAYLIMGVLGLVFFGIQAVGLCQIVLRGRGVFGAFGDGFAGAFKNLLPLLVLFVAYVVAVVVVAVAAILLVLLVGLLAKLVGAWFGIVLGGILYLAFLLACCVVAFGVMYHLWGDVCGGSDVVAAPGDALTV